MKSYRTNHFCINDRSFENVELYNLDIKQLEKIVCDIFYSDVQGFISYITMFLFESYL